MTKVLYVDDDDDIREIAVLALSLDTTFDVRPCASGEEALAEALSWSPDVIILDVMMPGMDGPETLRRLQEDLGEKIPPVLFCTARAQKSDIEKYKSLGALGVICKPFDPMMISANVREYLA